MFTLSAHDGALVCDNAACARRYPIVDGIAVIAPDVDAHLAKWGAELVDGEPEALAEHLSIYMDAHWGDHATPPPSSLINRLINEPEELINRLINESGRPVARAAELGCGPGRALYELSKTAQQVVGVDAQLAALKRARRILQGEPLEYGRRIIGRHYQTARITPPARVDNVTLVCADALDPPLVPGSFDRVVALNVLDAVPSPPQLVAVADGLCAPGGELILASPYAWQSGIVADEYRFGGADPAAALRARLVDGDALEARYTIEDEAELLWTLRRDARSAVVYRVHWLRARKAR